MWQKKRKKGGEAVPLVYPELETWVSLVFVGVYVGAKRGGGVRPVALACLDLLLRFAQPQRSRRLMFKAYTAGLRSHQKQKNGAQLQNYVYTRFLQLTTKAQSHKNHKNKTKTK